jgi:SEC-C motif-containing protein
MKKCYCKSGLNFAECCEPILRVEQVAPTALSLMRSRYAAYCLGDVNYLQATTHNSFWQHLEIVDFSDDMVEFKAYYIFENVQHLHHERSTFLKVNDMWKYVDGEIYEDKVTLLRNSTCICGSGQKYKRCCATRITQ